MTSDMEPPEMHRFTLYERVVHWWVGVTFLYLVLSGLSLSYSSLFWVTRLLGGGPATRVLHPWMGVLFFGGIVLMLARWTGEMRITRDEIGWFRAIRSYARHRREEVPPVGKYNPGQKLLFWTMAALALIYLLSGIPLWLSADAVDGELSWRALVNPMRLVHYAATVGGGLLLITHVYLGTLAFPGTFGGMLHGRVTRGWARLHHPLWEREESTE